jgi:hypothetical protein
LADQVAAAAKAVAKSLMIVSFMANSLTRYWGDYGRTHALSVLEDWQRGDALVECCVRLGAFVSPTDGLFTSIDLNPVFVRPRGYGVRIGDAFIEMRACAEQRND